MAAPDINNESTGLQPTVDCESWCRTRKSEDVKHKFVWTVENFTEELEKTETGENNCLESSEITFLGPENIPTKWILKLYPNGSEENQVGTFNILLMNNSSQEMKAGMIFSILDQNSMKKHSKTIPPYLFKSGYGAVFRIYNQATGATFRDPSSADLFPQGNLTIMCEITVKGLRKKTDVFGAKKLVKDVNVSNNEEEKISIDYEFALNDKDLSDVQILCKNRVFDCHRIILSARSTVFRAMFYTNMVEANHKKVEIKELEPSTVQAMLQYIYTGKTDFSFTKPEDLLAAANMYDLQNLRSQCENHLNDNLEISNCIDMLILGDLHEAEVLKRDALKLTALNMSNVVKSLDWKEKMCQYPILMTEVMQFMADDAEPPRKRVKC